MLLQRSGVWRRLQSAALVAALLTPSLLFAPSAVSAASVVPSGFQEETVFSGLINPVSLRFAADGRIFVAEKRGVVKVFDSLSDPTPDVFADLRVNTYNFWDRGMLGLALDPGFTTGSPYVYVLYAYNKDPNSSTFPRWVDSTKPLDTDSDPCPNPPGATSDGCVVLGRLSRLQAAGNAMTGAEQVLVEDWCQQYPSHSVGALEFGPDGALYATAGDGASFTFADYGQDGNPLNPCGDPPGGVGATLTPPTAEGGALRSQDVRTGGATSSYSSLVAADGAVSYWRLGDTGTTTAADSRGTNSGTYVGGYTQGVPGALIGDTNKAVTLDGTSGYIAVPDANSLDFGNGPLTYEMWVKRADQGTNYQLVYSKLSQGNLFFLNGKFTLDNDSTTIVQESGVTTDTNWHHFVVTRTGSGVGSTKLYKDGVDVTTEVGASASLSANSSSLSIGRYDATYGLYLKGSVDEVAVYKTALSAAQVRAHYDAGKAAAGTDPTGLDGTVVRVDPATGAGMPGNPFSASADPNARRIIAYGLRNPFRFTFRPGTDEIWVGDVGWNDWEEINRVIDVNDGVAENFGWPCYEGAGKQSSYDAANLNLCENLYTATGAHTAPYFAYNHSSPVVSGETCPTGSSSIAGLAFEFYSGGPYPAAYDGALFFADYSRDCIWAMKKGTGTLPAPGLLETFVAGAANPVDLQIGPTGELFYADFDGGTIRRIRYIASNNPPTAIATASPTSGAAPLTVQFDGTRSSDPDSADSLSYAWDLDGDGAYDDAQTSTATWTYGAGTFTVRLKVTDSRGASDISDPITINSGNTAPVPKIETPAAGTTWAVGDAIGFLGSAADDQPDPSLTWTLTLQHCPSNCHPHIVSTFTGASGSFSAPDHEYPSYLELELKATDRYGATGTTTLRLDPKTVSLTLASDPSGLQLVLNGVSGPAPLTRTVIEKSSNTMSATTPQTLNGTSYKFSSWSDGGAQTHAITATASATYTATYVVDSGTPPTNTVLPSISGPAQTGRTLTASTGTWTGTTPMTFTYQWRRCNSSGASCVDIAGATASGYLVVSADVGSQLRVVVTATNSAGSASATSNASSTIKQRR